MKNSIHLCKILICAGLLSAVCRQGHGAEMAIVPARPAELLKALPAAPSGWRMSVSTGEDIAHEWPRSKATREFVLEAANPSGQGPSIVLAKIQIVVIDTGGYPGSVDRFAEPVPGGEKPAEDRIMVASFPAFKKVSPDGKEKIDALALGRFLLKVTVESVSQQPGEAKSLVPKSEKVEDWIGKFNLEPLREATKKIEKIDVSKDHSMLVEKIDEINPSQSSKSYWSFSVEDQIQEKR